LEQPSPLELNNDQRREFVNTQQRFMAWQAAHERVRATRGSMVWQTKRGTEYLMRSYYEKSGRRAQKSLGVRSAATEKMKLEFERGREEAKARFASIDATLDRQAAINRAVLLGRVPMTSARIVRALERVGALGAGIRVVGTNAVYAYEASAGVVLDASITTTGDIDLLFDSRSSLHLVGSDEVSEETLLDLLVTVDKTFTKTRQSYRAQNADGYLVDLIKPMRSPAWKKDRDKLGDGNADDLTASEIEGLVWLENAPAFEAVAIDERGYPLRLVVVDPRVWAIHKHWVAKRVDRDPVKKQRDAAQAQAVGSIVARYLPHLAFESAELRMLPKEVVNDAAHLFANKAETQSSDTFG
jgi:hypothetical protein